jgi:hypothetical protein
MSEIKFGSHSDFRFRQGLPVGRRLIKASSIAFHSMARRLYTGKIRQARVANRPRQIGVPPGSCLGGPAGDCAKEKAWMPRQSITRVLLGVVEARRAHKQWRSGGGWAGQMPDGHGERRWPQDKEMAVFRGRRRGPGGTGGWARARYVRGAPSCDTAPRVHAVDGSMLTAARRSCVGC